MYVERNVSIFTRLTLFPGCSELRSGEREREKERSVVADERTRNCEKEALYKRVRTVSGSREAALFLRYSHASTAVRAYGRN